MADGEDGADEGEKAKKTPLINLIKKTKRKHARTVPESMDEYAKKKAWQEKDEKKEEHQVVVKEEDIDHVNVFFLVLADSGSSDIYRMQIQLGRKIELIVSINC